MKIIISLRCGLDITPNSHDYPTKKAIILVRRMNASILRMEGLRPNFRFSLPTEAEPQFLYKRTPFSISPETHKG